MRTDLKYILNELNSLGERINKLENESEIENDEFVCTTFSKNLINYSVLEKRKFFIAEFDVKKNKSLYITYHINGALQTKEKILIKLFIDGTEVNFASKYPNGGEVELSSFLTYMPNKSKRVKAEIEVSPENGILFSVSLISIVVVGLSSAENETTFDALTLNDKILLSYKKDNSLYYSYVFKTNDNYNINNFKYKDTCLSYSFVYVKNLNLLLLFRVDLSGRLFVSNFDDGNEIYIDDKVSFVSGDSNGDFAIASFIKNNMCFISKIRNFSLNHSENCINFNISQLNKCLIHYNSFKNKFFLILSCKNNSNYLIESIDEKFSNGENLKMKYSISISTYGGEAWSFCFITNLKSKLEIKQ